ncbi:uncharacterized protein LOC115534831 [Gadus morhua]|uniref:uncharacterized protein LOC115534831 n=1 Tax=Gadus morhua TaxID=8049 RepID=UPI0011B5A485|nr:uncharacterized protein LOC115534831 [Gadus morhua]
MSNLRQQGLKQPAVPERYPPAAAAEPGAARRRAGRRTRPRPGSTGGRCSPVTITTVSRASSPDRSPGARSPVSVLSVSASPVLEEASGPPELRDGTPGRSVFRLTPEKQPAPGRKSNITTTEDNRIHIHLGPGGPRPGEGPWGAGLSVRTLGVAEGRETSPGRRHGDGEDDEQHQHHAHHLGNLPAHAAAGRRRVPDPDVQGPEDLRQGGRGRRHGNQDGVALRGSADEDRAEEVGRVWPRLLVGREELSVSVATASGHADDKMSAGPLGLVGGA